MDHSPARSFLSFFSPSKSNLKCNSAKTKTLLWQKSMKDDPEAWCSIDGVDCPSEEMLKGQGRFSKRRSSAPLVAALGFPPKSSRKPSLKAIQNMKTGSTEVPSPSNSICYEEKELTPEQRKELRQAFTLFEKGGKNKMAARDLGELLRCLGWNPSERELEEAKHELAISVRGSVTFAEVERYVARRGGLLYGCRDEENIQEAFSVLDHHGEGKISVGKFKHFMTTLGEKMSDDEVEDMLQSLNKKKHTNFDSIEYTDLIESLEETTLGT